MNFLTCADLPKLHCFIAGSRSEELTVWAEVNRLYIPTVPFQDAILLPTRYVPNLD